MKKYLFIIIAVLFYSTLRAQQKVTGIVISATDKKSLQGATLIVEKLNITVVTDKNGNFKLPEIPSGSVLSVSFIGYKSRRIKLDFPLTLPLIITLTNDLNEMQEVVVSTGYQSLPVERATGSFSSVSNKEFNEQVSTDILSRLPAIASGVEVDRGTNPNGQLMVRGLSTIQGPKDPLIIVDNFPYNGNIENINPNDVENITILKDAAAASIWGARAGNGVIVITTKKGRFNQPIAIDFNSNVTIGTKPNLGYIKQMSSSDFIDVEEMLYSKGYYKNQISSSSRPALSPVVELLNEEANGQISASDANTQINSFRNDDIRQQFDKYMYQDAVNQQYSLNLRGGSSVANWTTGAEYDNDVDNLDAGYDRLNLHFQSEYKPLKNVTLTSAIYYTQSNSVSGKPGYGSVTSKGPGFYPYAQFADANGNPLPIVKDYNLSYISSAGNGQLLDWKYYPLTDWEHDKTKTQLSDAVFNFGLDYKLLDGLTASVKYQYERQETNTNQLQDEDSYYTRNYINLFTQLNADGSVTNIVPKGGILDFTNALLQSQDFRAQLNYDKVFGKNEIALLGGNEIRDAKTTGNQDRIYGYDQDGLTIGNVDYVNQYPTFVTGAPAYIQNDQNITDQTTRYVSFFANGSYTFDTRYTLSLSGRRDASNLFGLNTNDEWNPFWSGGLSWNIAKERFYKSHFVPYFRLRATYGLSGNINPAMVAVSTIAYLPQPSPYTNLPFAYFSNYYNPDLKWETTKMLNIAADFRLINNVVSGSIEFYRKTGTNLFGTAPLDYTTGVGAVIVKNVASMEGNGLDVQLKSININKGIKWTTTLNYSLYKDHITNYYLGSLQASNFINTSNVFPITGMKGYPVYSIFAYKWAGLDPQNGNPRGYVNGAVSEDYTTMTGSSTTISDLKYFGSAIPTSYGSFINTVGYKAFSLNFSFVYKFGYYFRRTSIDYSTLYSGWVGNSDFDKRWQKPGDENITNVPSLVYPVSSARSNFYAGSAPLVDKGDNVRLQYITFSYNVKTSWIKSIGLKSLEVYSNANNLGIVWRANKDHIDPDYNYGLYPLVAPQTYSLGVRAGF